MATLPRQVNTHRPVTEVSLTLQKSFDMPWQKGSRERPKPAETDATSETTTTAPDKTSSDWKRGFQAKQSFFDDIVKHAPAPRWRPGDGYRFRDTPEHDWGDDVEAMAAAMEAAHTSRAARHAERAAEVHARTIAAIRAMDQRELQEFIAHIHDTRHSRDDERLFP